MSTVATLQKQAKIPKQVSEELVEQVIYIVQNHLATLVETVINENIEKVVQETVKRSTKKLEKKSPSTENLLTRNEFLTAMQAMGKRFNDVNKRFSFIQWLIGIGFVVIPLVGTFLQNILN